MISGDPSKKDPRGNKRPYVQRYLSLFGAKTVHVDTRKEFQRKNYGVFFDPVLGLVNATLDHYNMHADDSVLWLSFRDFLIDGLGLTPSLAQKDNAGTLRLTVIQRKDDRKFLNLTAIVDDVVARSNRPLRPNIVTFEGMTVDQQAAVMRKTDILVGADGTGLMNGIYLPDSSCIVSILPFGVAELIPGKGKNFEVLLSKLGMRYVVSNSLPVPESKKIYELALKKETGGERYFMLKQNVNITSYQLASAIESCF
jgi:hypothetical protein